MTGTMPTTEKCLGNGAVASRVAVVIYGLLHQPQAWARCSVTGVLSCHQRGPRQAFTDEEPGWAVWAATATHLEFGGKEMSYSHRLSRLAPEGGGRDRQRAGQLKGEAQAPKHHSVTRCSRVGRNPAPKDEEEGWLGAPAAVTARPGRNGARLVIVSLKCTHHLLCT